MKSSGGQGGGVLIFTVSLPKCPQQLGLGQAEARSQKLNLVSYMGGQELNLASYMGSWTPRTGAITCFLPGALVESWIRSVE